MYLYIEGKLKSTLADTNDLIGVLLNSDADFYLWYNNKFLKWDGFADREDERVLNESVSNLLEQLADTWTD